MASSVRAALPLAVNLAAKAMLIGILAFGALHLTTHEHYFATALVLLGLAALLVLSLARTAGIADRMYADFVEAIAAGEFDWPSSQGRRFPVLAEALRRASDRLSHNRYVEARRMQELDTLLDTVSAVLLVIGEDGQLVLANRAARAFAGRETQRLADIPAIGPLLAARLMQLLVGAKEIVRLADKGRMLASMAMFRGAEGVPKRLISLQSLSGELSAVETGAWQDLVRVLSHEMMNSLTPIVSMSESLQQLLCEPEGRPDRRMRQEARTAAEVIARRSAGLMSFVDRYRRLAELPEPQLKALPLKELFLDLDRLATTYAKGREVSYRSVVEPLDLTVRADRDLLQQALINLVKNAIEAVAATPNPRVEVLCRGTENQILIEVSDNGAGLPESEPEQIFTPFFTTKPDGSGIGLALARQVVVAHGGELGMRRLSPGTTFALRLPLAGRENRCHASECVRDEPAMIEPEMLKDLHEEAENPAARSRCTN
jgi:nitrogen fixation/metabolism regulation signal transduction histidine kinase